MDYPEITVVKRLFTFNGLVSFYLWFTPNCVSLMRPSTNQLRVNAKVTTLDDNTNKASSTIKELVTKATMLTHQNIKAPINITIDARNSAKEVLQQWTNNCIQSLTFFL